MAQKCALGPWRTTETDGPELCRRTAHERKIKASSGELHGNTEKRGYLDPKRNQNQHQKRGTTHIESKTKFFIENQQDYNRSAEVTALPPSFDWKLKIGSCLTPKLEMQNKIWEVARSPNPLGFYI
jgi:hypothetical protein